MSESIQIIEQLSVILKERLSAETDKSYVASLYMKGNNKILEKVGEEATEVILAAKDCEKSPEKNKALVKEVADLWFHTMVLLTHLGISPIEVLEELQRRFGESGLVEKSKRNN